MYLVLFWFNSNPTPSSVKYLWFHTMSLLLVLVLPLSSCSGCINYSFRNINKTFTTRKLTFTRYNIDSPHYSPDLTPCYFFLNSKLKFPLSWNVFSVGQGYKIPSANWSTNQKLLMSVSWTRQTLIYGDYLEGDQIFKIFINNLILPVLFTISGYFFAARYFRYCCYKNFHVNLFVFFSETDWRPHVEWYRRNNFNLRRSHMKLWRNVRSLVRKTKWYSNGCFSGGSGFQPIGYFFYPVDWMSQFSLQSPVASSDAF